jgi:hypothetical protein
MVCLEEAEVRNVSRPSILRDLDLVWFSPTGMIARLAGWAFLNTVT